MRIQDVASGAARYSGDFLRTWFELAQNRDALEESSQKFLPLAQKLIVERLDFLSLIPHALDWLVNRENELAECGKEGFADFLEEKATWEDLQKRIIEKYGRDDLTLNVLLQEFDLSEKSAPVPPDAVRCLTIHTAKGMEFEHVYLVGLVEDQLPSFQAIKKGDTSKEMQEERRNCFVAITRCRSTLTLTYANEYFGWGKQPSRFLREMELLNSPENL